MIGFTDLDETIEALKQRITLGERLVFLLGAGCSMQYGLPGFRQLLEHLGAALGRPRYPPTQSLEAIREDLDRIWLRHLTAGDRREQLRKVLTIRGGRDCSGYIRLARLAQQGHVKAFVNMNFDLLLEEALDREKVSYRVTNTFSVRPRGEELRVIKPHGSIGPLDARREADDLILDLAKSDLFTSEKERTFSQRLFSSHDTVVLGYSGVDQKIADVLRPTRRGEAKKLFIINVAAPDRRLLLAAEQRDPWYFLTIGEEASFENFAEELDRALRSSMPESTKPRRTLPKLEEFDLMTRAEREAFSRCLDLATRIWWSSGAAEGNSGPRGPIVLLDHAREVFDLALRLASAGGFWLSSPEKYLLRCAGVLHDLGFFTSLRREAPRAIESRGAHTAELLEESLRRDETLKLDLIPHSYGFDARDNLVKCMLRLCQLDEDICMINEFSIGDLGAPVRPKLINALFVLAERLARNHIFLPSQDTLPDASGQIVGDNPHMDLFLNWSLSEVNVEIGTRQVTVHGPMEAKEASWFLLSCRKLMETLDQVVRNYGGFGLRLEGWPTADLDPGRALDLSLEQALAARITEVEPAATDEKISLLDLVALFGLDDHSTAQISVDTSMAVSSVLERLQKSLNHDSPNLPLLAHYLDVRRKHVKDTLDALFLKSFETILYPAWRFFGRNWRDNVESILAAEISLDMGSSRFRSEVIPGLRQLLREKIEWEGDLASGHDGCTQCTSRLLFIFSHAMLLFPRDRIREDFRDSRGRDLEGAIRGILLYFLARPSNDISWWGLGGFEKGTFASPDYLAHAAWSVAFCLHVDREFHMATGEHWIQDTLGINKDAVESLACQRSQAVLQLTEKELFSANGEEPTSYTLGSLGRQLLKVMNLPNELVNQIFPHNTEQQMKTLANVLEKAWKEFSLGSVLTRLFLWPAVVFLDKIEGDSREDLKHTLATTCLECISSPLWVRQGQDTGSWGFNVRNTYTIAGALASFWEHALAPENREAFARLFESLTSENVTGVSRRRR